MLAGTAAQALGTPVVAAAVGGLTEVVDDGVTGVLVRDPDPAALAGAIASLLDDEPRRRAMAGAARERGESFTWERASERLAAIYGRVTSPQAPSATPCGYSDDLLVAAG